MRQSKWKAALVLSLIAASALLYLLHYSIFHDAHHILIYLVGDVAFLPIEVLLVTLVIHQLLSNMERRGRLEKLNMVIGAFFSEVGTKLLGILSSCDEEVRGIRDELVIGKDWTPKEFGRMQRRLKGHRCSLGTGRAELEGLRKLLVEKRDFMVRLLENPSVLEHESFTELLRAVFHLTEELESREDFEGLPKTDLEHLAGDMKRVYGLVVMQWLEYMRHLKGHYPYLFSLAMRTNPFDLKASPVVE